MNKEQKKLVGIVAVVAVFAIVLMLMKYVG